MKLFALGLSLYVVLQSPAAAPTAQQNAKSTIEGIVVRAGSSDPIAGARISVVPTGGSVGPVMPFGIGGPRSGSTDKDGKFVLKDLDAGQYRVIAARNGYARQEYGQRALDRPGIVLNLAAGQTIRNVVISLMPAGFVTGRITNDAGDPLVGIDVNLLRPVYNPSGVRNLNPFATARTNDLGEYRLYWITPGHYYVSASYSRMPNVRLPNANEVLDDVYGTMYFPGTADSALASMIEVRPGGDIGGIDFRMTSQQTYHVRGRLIDSRTGQPPRNANIFLNSRQPTGAFGVTTFGPNYNAATGTFDLADVLPGRYWLRAMASDDALFTPMTARTAAQFEVDVSGADVENLVLTILPGTSIPGRLQVEGKSSLAGVENFDRFRVLLSSLVPGMTPVLIQPPVPKQDGSFTLEGVVPGEYRISVVGLPQDYYIKEARIGTADILQNGFSMTRPQSERLEILLSPNGGQVDGDVVDERGDVVRGIQAVFIPDRNRDRSDLFKTAVTDQNGHFTVRGLSPGAYKLFAWEELERFAYFDPEILRRYELQGKAITVSESSKLTVQVKVIPAGQ